jgi:acid phosphatase
VLAWENSAQDAAIAPTLALFNAAKAKGVSVFFITGRSETIRAATETNLRNAGYDGWSALVMRPAGTSTPSAADYKAPERGKIAAQGFTIIANVGDQPSDLAGGYAERIFLVPNPFYRIP